MGNYVQASLDLFDEPSLAAIAATQSWLKRPERRAPKTKAATLPPFEQINVELPLFDVDDFLVGDITEEIGQAPALLRQPHVVEAKGWSIELAALWMAKFLYRQLELLLWSKDGTTGARTEILRWIFATGYEWRIPDDWCGWAEDSADDTPGKKPPRRSGFVGPPPAELIWTSGPEQVKDKNLHLVPFSFECCCWVDQIDPERIRRNIQERLSQLAASDGRTRIRAALH